MSTRNFIALMLLLVAGLPVCAGAWLLHSQQSQAAEMRLDQRLGVLSFEISNELRQRIDVGLEGVRADGSLPGLAEAISSADLSVQKRLTVNRLLTALKGRDPLNIADISVIDAAGIVRASTNVNALGSDHSAAEDFLTVSRVHRPLWFSRAPDAEQPVSSLIASAPIRDASDRTVGVLRLNFQPAMLTQVLEAEIRESPDFGARLYGPLGSLLAEAGAKSDVSGISTATATIPHTVGSDVKSVRAIASLLPRSGWRLVTFEPSALATERQREIDRRWLAQISGLAALLAASAWLIGHLIAAPVVRLRQTVDAIAEGDIERRTTPAGTREIRRLGEAVNAMNHRLAENLGALTLELEQRREIERSLTQSEERLSTLINQLPGTVYRSKLDPPWEMDFVSRQIEQLTGLSPDELITQRSNSYAAMIAAEDYEISREKIRLAAQEQRPYDLYYRLFHRDGSMHWIWERGQAHCDGKGNALWLDGVLFDVSDARRAELLVSTLRESLDHQVGGSYFASLTLAVRSAFGLQTAFVLHRDGNGAMELLAIDSALDCAAITLVAALDPALQQAVKIRELSIGSGFSRLYPGVDLAGACVEALFVLALRSDDGRIIGVIAAAHDRPLNDPDEIIDLLRLCAPRTAAEIERADAAAALQALAGELEHRVEQRTRELEASHAQLSQAMEQVINSEKLASLGSLVAGVAHELSTPIGNALTSASAFQSLLREFDREARSGQLRRSSLMRFVGESHEAGELIERNLHRAAEQITHFKQVAVDQTSARRRRFDLGATLNEVLTTLRPRLKRLPHKISANLPDGIELDSFPGPFEQVITNLITNSLDHAFRDGTIGTIEIYAKLMGQQVNLEYADDGVGIPAEHMRRIFDPFFTTRLGSGGSGLGLYLVHSLVTGVLGGSIRTDSAAARGTRFFIELPLVAPAPSEPSMPPPATMKEPERAERSQEPQ